MGLRAVNRLMDNAMKEGTIATPPVAVSFWTLDNVVILATLTYVVIMTGRIIYQWRNEIIDRKESRKDEDDD